MSPPKVVTGARAKVFVGPPNRTTLIGILNNISYNVVYDTQDAYVLGRLSPAEIGYTAVEPVSGSMGFWRVVNHSAYAELGLPNVKDLLTADYTSIAIEDRVTGAALAKIQGVRLLGFSGGNTARQMAEGSVPFKGMMLNDEVSIDKNAEPTVGGGSSDLP